MEDEHVKGGKAPLNCRIQAATASRLHGVMSVIDLYISGE